MKFRPGPTQERLHEVVHYDPETGIFRWLPKPGSSREINRWNSRHAGKVAGAVGPGGYRDIRIDGVMLKAHRLAWLYMTGDWPEDEIDHKDGDPDNNRIDNLRPATHSQNMKNTKPRKNNSSGFKGVCFFAKDQKWHANIQTDKVKQDVGAFASPEQAYAAYCKAAAQLHGEFARVA